MLFRSERLAEEVDWEYLAVEEAAEAADWIMASDSVTKDDEAEQVRDDWP